MEFAKGPRVADHGLTEADYEIVHAAVRVVDTQITPENIRAYKAPPGHVGVEIAMDTPVLAALFALPVWLYQLRQYYVRAGWATVRIDADRRTLTLEN